MTTDDLVRTGDLAGALRAQTAQVRSNPTDAAARTALIHLLVLSGEWDRAEMQLLTLAQQDQSLQMAAALYRSLLAAEEERARAYAGHTSPNFPPNVAASVMDRAQALAAIASKRWTEAGQLLESARRNEATSPGLLDRIPFSSLGDYDDLLHPVLEVFAGGRYFWVPYASLTKIATEPPRGALDLVWLPATITERHGVEAKVHLPVHYALSHTHSEGSVRTGRRTEWEDIEGIAFRGFGPRVLVIDGTKEMALLEIRQIELTEPRRE